MFLIAGRHSIEMAARRAALSDTSSYRASGLVAVTDALINFVTLHQVDSTRFVDQAQLDAMVPANLQEVVDAISRFLDPVLAAPNAEAIWDPDDESWSGRPT